MKSFLAGLLKVKALHCVLIKTKSKENGPSKFLLEAGLSCIYDHPRINFFPCSTFDRFLWKTVDI